MCDAEENKRIGNKNATGHQKPRNGDLLYGDGCFRHPHCESCPFSDCVWDPANDRKWNRQSEKGKWMKQYRFIFYGFSDSTMLNRNLPDTILRKFFYGKSRKHARAKATKHLKFLNSQEHGSDRTRWTFAKQRHIKNRGIYIDSLQLLILLLLILAIVLIGWYIIQ